MRFNGYAYACIRVTKPTYGRSGGVWLSGLPCAEKVISVVSVSFANWYSSFPTYGTDVDN